MTALLGGLNMQKTRKIEKVTGSQDDDFFSVSKASERGHLPSFIHPTRKLVVIEIAAGQQKQPPFRSRFRPGNDPSGAVNNLVFIGHSPTILAPFKLCSSPCCIIAGAMGNHLHDGASGLAVPPVAEGLEHWERRQDPACLTGTLGRYRGRLARDGNDRIAACRLRFNVFNLELGEGLSSSYSTGLDRDRFHSV